MGATMRVVMANRSLKRQVVMAAAVWVFCAAVVIAQAQTGGAGHDGLLDKWVTPQNIVTAGVLIYGLGVLREQFSTVRAQVAELKADFKEYTDKTAPETYVRKDVLDARLPENTQRAH